MITISQLWKILKYEKFEEYLDSMTAELNVVKKDNILNRIKVKY